MAYDTVKQLLEQNQTKPRLENGAVNRIETINIDDELEDEGAVEDDEADDDIEETRVNSFSGVKKMYQLIKLMGHLNQALLQMKMITIQYSETPS